MVTTIDHNVAIITFNRPRERNPLSVSTLQDLERVLADLLLRSDVKTLIFTGTADVFASGANIHELSKLDSQSALQFSQLGQRVFQTIADARPLTIAAVNGYCMGGALDLALACKIRVASESAVFSHPGARLGIITGWGGTQRLPALIGRARALELFATARRIRSAEALLIGLVTCVKDPVLDCAVAVSRDAVRSKITTPTV